MKSFFQAILLIASVGTLFGQGQAGLSPDRPGTTAATEESQGLPLSRVAIFSSGVGFFEHAGEVSGTESAPAELPLSFNLAAVNDALKSLIINDPLSASPSVRYPSEETLLRTLRSLKVDLSGRPGIAEILNSLRGETIEVSAPGPITGRIIGVEYREGFRASGERVSEAALTIFGPQGIRSIAMKDIASFVFKNERIQSDLNRALDLLAAAGNDENRTLLVSLPGAGKRRISLSYVIPSPVWKVTYRLDLSGGRPFFQGWAVVDNDSDIDWQNVELSLVTGRPVSFIQNLYAPYRTARPVVPLAIAGVAEGMVRESGWDEEAPAEDMQVNGFTVIQERSSASAMKAAPVPAPAVAAGAALETAAGGGAVGAIAGDQFQFTLAKPVTLARRESAMLPLVEGSIGAEKFLVLSGGRITGNSAVNPAISAEITNSTGMSLPAGPITVYDGGTYAGDALIGFLSGNEKRLISYGEDLSVTGSARGGSSRSVSGVVVSGGVMTIRRRQIYEKTYTVKNASGEDKLLIIEHPVTEGATLTTPAAYRERTNNLYRFDLPLKAKGTASLKVSEERPVSERIVLSQMRPESFAAYIADGEIPAAVRAAFERAGALKKSADDAVSSQGELENRKNLLVQDQDRVRKNLEAVGNMSPQGQEYLKRMIALDNSIDSLAGQIEEARSKTLAARKAYDEYLSGLNLGTEP